MIDKIYDIVLKDRQIKVREIIECGNMPQYTVFSNLHEKFSVKKISTRWVPRLHTMHGCKPAQFRWRKL